MALNALAAVVAEKTGFDEKALSERRLLGLALRLESEHLGEGDLTNCPLLEEWASEAVSVGETYFFRQAEHFEFLAQQMGRWSSDARPLLAWSAGCSTGEEAWSLAAVLSHGMDPGHPLEIIGSDMSEKNLSIARQGIYGKWSMRREGGKMPEVLQGANPDRMEVVPALRPLVEFKRHNLLDAAPLNGRKARLIFCRNVLIYLNQAAVRRVISNLVAALEDDGLLVMGSVDIDFVPLGLVPEHPRVLQIYRKPRRLSPIRSFMAIPQEEKTMPLPAFDPKQLHLMALQKAEQDELSESLAMLLELRLKAPRYLPGLFDLAMTLSRRGAKHEAAATLESLLELARDRDLLESMDAPEPVSLIFYVTSAQTFLQRYGRIS
jgi:chemotaxis protein methyltransferase CheR